jgi:hypothetical protein
MPSRAESRGFKKCQARIHIRDWPPLQPSHRDATHSRMTVPWCAERSVYGLDPGQWRYYDA